MSHEIRTPLNAILGYTQMMRRDPALVEEARAAIQAISANGQHLLGLVNEVLDLAKIEAGRMELTPVDFDLRRMGEILAATFKPLCAEKRIRFRLEIPAGSSTRVRGDEGKLRQVLINLIGNAVKFTTAGQVYVHLHSPSPGHWRFEVIDTGLGIPDEEQPHIFKPFHQGKGGQHQGGAGLGLTIAQRQVQLLGGVLALESQRGIGSRFHFVIPLENAPDSGREEETVTSPQADAEWLRGVGLSPVRAPEPLAARLMVAAELHSTTSLKAALPELRQLGPEAARLADEMRACLRSYDLDRVQRLVADFVLAASHLPAAACEDVVADRPA